MVVDGVVLTAVGCVYIGLGVPMMCKKVQHGAWYGIRTEKTLSDPEIWYAVNQVAGIDFLLAGLLTVGASAFNIFVSLDHADRQVALINFAAFLVGTALALLHTFRTLERY